MGSGLRVWGLGLRVQGLGLRVSVYNEGFWTSVFGLGMLDSGDRILRFTVR
jgi:hypothetical protein